MFQGLAFSTLEDFASAAAKNPDFAKEFSCEIYRLAEFAGIKKPDGFRLAALNKTPSANFGFRFLAGEALGDSVVSLTGGRGICGSNTGVEFNTEYDDLNPYYTLIKDSGHLKHKLENEDALSFADAHPAAKVHRLALPKGRFVSLFDFSRGASKSATALFWQIIARTVKDAGLAGSDFRVITDAGLFAHQQVGHLHLRIASDPNLGALALTCDENPIFTTKKLINILPYIDSKTLVVFDMDQTLIMDPKHAGNVNFPITKLAFVEPQTAEILRHVKQRTDMIVGLTARGYFSTKDDATLRLQDLGFTLDYSWLNGTNYAGLNQNNVNFGQGYKKGVIYTQYNAKSPFLLAFLQELNSKGLQVQRVIFVDDSLTHCKDVSQAMKLKKLESRVFHYTPNFFK